MPSFRAFSPPHLIFSDHPKAGNDIASEFLIRLTPHARLSAKVLICRNRAGLQRVWKDVVGQPVCRRTQGVVSAMLSQRERHSEGRPQIIVEGNARFFCIIGLARGHLTTNIICHEAVHAGFAYSKRVARTPFAAAHDFDEERIAYPAGIIAARINDWLHANDMHDKRK